MGNRLQVEGLPGFVRDTNSGAIININKGSMQAARNAKEKRKIKDNEYNQMKRDIRNLKGDISDIKMLLHQLIEK